MGVTIDIGDIDKSISQFKERVKHRFIEVGSKSVDVARAEGNYRNRTGNLRRSSYYRADENELVIGNTADYASDVEMRGYDVMTSAILFAKGELSR